MSAFSEEFKLIKLDDYEQFVGSKTIDRILSKASLLQDRHVVNVNSTLYGGGVAEILTSLTLLMNDVGLHAGWRVLQGMSDFFNITKEMHNALQGGKMNLTRIKKQIFEYVVYENSIRKHLQHHDIVVIHDPQPLTLIDHYKRKGPWIWRCHIDLTNPHDKLWEYLKPFIQKYDAIIVSIKEYLKNDIDVPQSLFMPAINPFTIKNKTHSENAMNEVLAQYNIPTDLPLVVQVSRYDRWKDPEGVIKAFKKARKEVDATLVLLGNAAADDPEGSQVYESLLSQKEDRILILPHGDDTFLVHALQTKADIVIQKSIREGFGLTVTEAMWKGTPVIGGNVGGIRYQIKDGVNGFLVNDIDETVQRIVILLKDKKLRDKMGVKARETVKEKFLMTRLLEQYLDLFNSFETVYRIKQNASRITV